MPGIAVLGPIRVIGDDGQPAAVGSRRQCVLLAVLVSRLDRVVSADELVEALWAEELPEHPAAALQSQVFRLRRQLPAAAVEVATEGSGYRLLADRDQVDATRFEDLVARAAASRSEPATAVGVLDDALSLWRGRAYLEVADHYEVLAEASRLEEVRADATEQRAALLVDLGDTSAAARAMETLMDGEPFRERPVAIRMRALAREGRHADALHVYDEFRRTLGGELGLEPSPELRALESEILRHELPAPPRTGLPGNSLVGREVALAETVSRLAGARLVTLTGPGGVGKTRLALHIAARVAEQYPDGVWLCELANVGVAESVALSVASVLHLQRQAGATAADQVVQFLGSRRALVVFDNCEHVLDGAGNLIGAILARAPDVDIVATSRQRLGVEGEHVLRVAALPVADWDDPDSPAVALFVDRAKAVRPDFALTPDNLTVVCELCRRVDGLPLALELAASRTLSRTPAEILAEVAVRIDRLSDPLRARERHRSIEAVMSWSYDPLGPVERHVLRTVAVFSGGFTAEAAAAVADVGPDDVVAALSTLAERSLVAAHDAGGTTRFSMLEPIRQYAEARLTDEDGCDVARARHAVWAAEWIERADVGLRGADEARWSAAITAEQANLRAAHHWALDHDSAIAMRIAGAMFWFAWYGTSEAFEWAAATVERVGDDAGPALTRACATAALGAARSGDITTARGLAERGIALAADDPVAARFTWLARSSPEMMTGNYEDAAAYQQRALELARLAGDTTQEAREHAAQLPLLRRSDKGLGEVAAAEPVGELGRVAGCRS